MVSQWPDAPLPSTSFTMYLSYEEILINQVLKEQTPVAVGCNELPEQDNPGRVARLCLGRCRHSVSWVEEGFCEGLTLHPGLKSWHLMTAKLLSWWKAGPWSTWKEHLKHKWGRFEIHWNCGTCCKGCKATLKTLVRLWRVFKMESLLLDGTKNAYGNTLKK